MTGWPYDPRPGDRVASEGQHPGAAKLKPGTTAVGPSGLQWNYSGRDSDDHLPILGHEMGLVNIAKALMPLDGVAIDVGAHVGLYTLELARKGRVIAWEANAETSLKLQAHAGLNREHLRRMPDVVTNAAWHCETVLGLVDPNGYSTGGSTQVHEYPDETGGRRVRAFPLDCMLDWYGAHAILRVDLIKIDVEGAESNVLRGAGDLITKFKPALMIEMHDFLMGEENRGDVQELLEALNYEHGADIPNGEGYSWIAKPKKENA